MDRTKVIICTFCLAVPASIYTWKSESTNTKVNHTSEYLYSSKDLASLQGHLKLFPEDALQLTFCGDYVPFHLKEVREKYEHELKRFTRYKKSAGVVLARAQKYYPLIRQIITEYHLPEDIFYMCLVESALTNVTSHKGAKGVWQFMRSTAEELDLEISETVDERYHLEKSTRAACRYLRSLYRQSQDWALVAAAYNMGLSRLNRRIKHQKTSSYYELELNKETSAYVYRILAIKTAFNHPQNFNITLAEMDQEVPFEEITISEPIEDLGEFAQSIGSDLETLKTLNPWLISKHFTPSKGKEYIFKLPTSEESDKTIAAITN